jgi:SAM-dependent methyltransferase
VEAADVGPVLQFHGIAGQELLGYGLGSATGRHGTWIAQGVYRVHGLERSAAMVAAAQQPPCFSCHQVDITSTRLDHRFDAVLSLLHVVSYQATNAAVQSVFARAADHLRPGALFLFDVWYSPAVAAQPSEVRVKRIAADGMEITRLAEPISYNNDNRVQVQYAIFAQDTASGTM